MRYYTSSGFAKRIGVSPRTLLRWEKAGKMSPAGHTDGGHRRYTEEQVQAYFRSHGMAPGGEGCTYCTGDQALFSDDADTRSVLAHRPGTACWERVPARYCPMCGRKL